MINLQWQGKEYSVVQVYREHSSIDPFGAFDLEDQDILDAVKREVHPTYLGAICETLAKLPRVIKVIAQRVSDFKGIIVKVRR
jgi:hypothetical protein